MAQGFLIGADNTIGGSFACHRFHWLQELLSSLPVYLTADTERAGHCLLSLSLAPNMLTGIDLTFFCVCGNRL
jgi:hypothetical protein